MYTENPSSNLVTWTENWEWAIYAQVTKHWVICGWNKKVTTL